ncbi:MAG TPA: FtsQ-type POTRA domain-containing protein [Acidimicrobiales bacterium]|nr:FtsQ-type POTRA domain-containing protein [Acidimicrobiales bacterium]
MLRNQARRVAAPWRALRRRGGTMVPGEGAGDGIDPRIRQRRDVVRRGRSRRRWWALGGGLGAGAAGVAALVVLHSPLLAVRTVRVRGTSHVPRAQVLALVGVGRTTPLVDIRPGPAEAALERLPWVASAQVTRSWPSTLEVHITERVPIAQLRTTTGSWAEVDRAGEVLARAGGPFPGVVMLAGPTLAQAQAAGRDAPGLAVAAALPASLRRQVAQVDVLPGGQVALGLAHGGKVVLGTTTGLHQKLASAAVMVNQVDLHNVAVIDVRVPGLPTLTRG